MIRVRRRDRYTTTTSAVVVDGSGAVAVAELRWLHLVGDAGVVRVTIRLVGGVVGPIAPNPVSDGGDGGDTERTWVLHRDLVWAGLHAPTGTDDDTVWVAPRPGGRLCLRLRDAHGWAWVDTRARPVNRWLRRTLLRVPRGAEAAHWNADAALAGLVGGAR